MMSIAELKRSLMVAAWFAFLTFPLLVIKVDPIERTVLWRWENMLLARIEYLTEENRLDVAVNEPFLMRFVEREPLIQVILREPRYLYPLSGAVLLFALVFPSLFSTYQTNIMITALMYVMLGLGLNIVVGLAGLLDLGYVAFYAVGA